jgi:hypothetical protein
VKQLTAYRKPRDPGYVGGFYWTPTIVGFIGLSVMFPPPKTLRTCSFAQAKTARRNAIGRTLPRLSLRG